MIVGLLNTAIGTSSNIILKNMTYNYHDKIWILHHSCLQMNYPFSNRKLPYNISDKIMLADEFSNF